MLWVLVLPALWASGGAQGESAAGPEPALGIGGSPEGWEAGQNEVVGDMLAHQGTSYFGDPL